MQSYKYQRMYPEKAVLALASRELNLYVIVTFISVVLNVMRRKLIPSVDGKAAIAQLVAVQVRLPNLDAFRRFLLSLTTVRVVQ